MTTPFAIRTRTLRRCFGDHVAVAGIDLAVPAGTVYGFLGPNGAGKTTTIRMLLGLIRPDGGAIEVLGRPLGRERKAVLARVGALVEDPSLYPHLTGRENLEATRRILGVERDRIAAVLERTGIADVADRKVSTYSRGMRQRLALALALLPAPDLLVLDEPTNGLDPAGIQQMRRLIRALSERDGITVFLSSHLLSEVEQICDHVGILSRGRLLFQGSLDALHRQVEPVLEIGTAAPRRALEVLAGGGWAAGEAGSRVRVRVAGGREDAARVNSALVSADVPVYSLHLRRPTLEDIFLELTTDDAPSSPAAVGDGVLRGGGGMVTPAASGPEEAER